MKKYHQLNSQEKYVILDKGTEAPFTGKYNDFYQEGLYLCKQCGVALYSSNSKFDSGCGWPAFDDELPNAIMHLPDADGRRTEIICNSCNGHLGHVFIGEKITEKNTRHCVNSISLKFIPAEQLETAVVAGGCFWGVQYLFDRLEGVVYTEVGYAGGVSQNPTYEDICHGDTGHAEVLLIRFDTMRVSYKEIITHFFNIHDPSQLNRQGPDIGEQYRSTIFYDNEAQKSIAEELSNILRGKGCSVATTIEPYKDFWTAEEYHQKYYFQKGATPYCHYYKNRF